MGFPPPRNGYFYSERELLMQREQIHIRERRGNMMLMPFLALLGGWPGFVIGCILFLVQGFYLGISDNAWQRKGQYWDDYGWMLKAQRIAFWIAVPACLLAPPHFSAIFLALWGWLLSTIEPWLRKPSERELADAAAYTPAPTPIRE